MTKLYIHDETVSDTASRLGDLPGTTQTEAVQQVLTQELARREREIDLIAQVRDIQERVRVAGFKRLADEKEFLSKISGGI